MDQLKKYNDGVTFLLTGIDLFSRYAFARPLLNKKSAVVLEAFLSILNESGRKQTNCQTDLGSEFISRGFKSALEELGINYYVTFSENKAAVIERFNRTLKSKIWK